jgi:hypothetical protein
MRSAIFPNSYSSLSRTFPEHVSRSLSTSNSLWSCGQNFTQIHDTRLFRIYLEYDATTRRPKRQQNVRNYATPSLRRLASLLRRITLSTDSSF